MNKAKVTIDRAYEIGGIDKRLYGSFVEHLGRCVYEGIYEPTHPMADEMGFRGDVLALVKELKIPITRYPGGNFVSGYDWEDGIGPKEARPTRYDLAWKVAETNHVGVNEFVEWAKKAETEVMMAVNLGTKGPMEAANLVEYCNYPGGTYYSDLRKSHGYPDPHKIKTWCLGNEMDGPWQIGEKTPKAYGKTAYEAAKLMKRVDETVELVACGSSSHYMPSFPHWDLTVLKECYEMVEFLSLHIYYDIQEGRVKDFLASGMEMDNYIKTAISVCDYVKARKKGKKDIMLSFDEWNVWFLWRDKNENDKKGLYNFRDALVFGTLINALIRNANRVKIGCQAQLVNLLGPIFTEKGGKAWRQTIFYPYLYASLYGQGISLLPVIKAPLFDGETIGGVPSLDVSATVNQMDGKEEIALFMVNLDMDNEMDVEIDMRSFNNIALVEHISLYHDNLLAVNNADNPVVLPTKTNGTKIAGGILHTRLAKHSWHCLRLESN